MKTVIRGNVAVPATTRKDKYGRSYESFLVFEDRYEKHGDTFKKTGKTAFRITAYNTEAKKIAKRFPKGALVEIEGAFSVKNANRYIIMYKGKEIRFKAAA